MCMQTLYKCKQDKHPFIRNCTCNYNCNYNYLANYYPLYKYLLKSSPEAYILESLALAIKQCKQVFYLPGIGI
jgi:hypothetical protein